MATSKANRGVIKTLPIAEIEVNKAVQIRIRMDQSLIREYAEGIKAGEPFPPVIVFAEKGAQRYVLADGGHRLEARKLNGEKKIDCVVREGNLHDALEYALTANHAHGQRLNTKDRRRAIELALLDPEWSEWSALRVAGLCRVSDKTVSSVREDLVLQGKLQRRDTIKTERDGKVIERPATVKREDKPESETRKSESPPRRQPKTMAESLREDGYDALDTLRAMPFDGVEAVRQWGTDRKEAFEFVRDWCAEAAMECEKGQ